MGLLHWLGTVHSVSSLLESLNLIFMNYTVIKYLHLNNKAEFVYIFTVLYFEIIIDSKLKLLKKNKMRKVVCSKRYWIIIMQKIMTVICQEKFLNKIFF